MPPRNRSWTNLRQPWSSDVTTSATDAYLWAARMNLPMKLDSSLATDPYESSNPNWNHMVR